MIDCDANMCPEDFEKKPVFQSRHVFIEAPGEGVSTFRSKGPNGEFIERTHDSVVSSHGLQGKIKNMEVVEDFESIPHKAVTFWVETESSGCGVSKKYLKLFLDSVVESCQDVARKKKNEVLNEISAGVPRETDAAGCGVTPNAVFEPKALMQERF